MNSKMFLKPFLLFIVCSTHQDCSCLKNLNLVEPMFGMNAVICLLWMFPSIISEATIVTREGHTMTHINLGNCALVLNIIQGRS